MHTSWSHPEHLSREAMDTVGELFELHRNNDHHLGQIARFSDTGPNTLDRFEATAIQV